MAKINIVLQGKGGVGKSVVSTLLAQYKLHRGETPLCIDADPLNQTFTGFGALAVRQLDLMAGEEIDPRKFDNLVEMIARTEQDVVIDSGAGSFKQLAHYIVSNEVPALLESLGHEFIVHTVITGGPALVQTVNGLDAMAKQFPKPTKFVVWLNPFFGEISHAGKGFEALNGYTQNKSRVSAIVRIPSLAAATYGRDMAEMLGERKIFSEALADEARTIMARQRLKIVQREIFGELEKAAVV